MFCNIVTNYIAFFLDVDGTLLDSLGTKNNIFIHLLSEEGIPADFSAKIILDSVALTREERFKKVWRSYHHEEIPSIVLEKLLKLSQVRLLDSEYIPSTGADLFIKTFGPVTDLHIVSAANHVELVQSFHRLGWHKFFLTINADLKNKSVAFNKIMNDFCYPKNACLSVGDTERDCSAANESGIDHWWIGHDYSENLAQNNKIVGSSLDFLPLIEYLS